MRALLYYLLSFSVANAVIHLELNTEHINVQIGDKPDLQCYTEESANFLIMNPLTWQKIDRDGSKRRISTLANVETRFEQEYDIILDANATGLIFTLQFLQGIKEEHDGFFSCEIHSQNDQVLAEKSVEVSVIRFTSQPTISSPVIQSTTQVPGQCDFKGALQCTRTVGTDTLQRFATASFTNITEVENFCWSLEHVYLCIGTKLDYCSKDIRLLRDVILSGSRYLCNTDRTALLNGNRCIHRLAVVNTTSHCMNNIEEMTPFIMGEKSVFNHTVEFCRIGTSWTTCFMATAKYVCDRQGYSYMYNYTRHTFMPINNALHCDLLSGIIKPTAAGPKPTQDTATAGTKQYQRTTPSFTTRNITPLPTTTAS
ncbi:unnamed protein product [Mytilus edulis]|uniref:Ig-like domain-containing protein n=1 Tax=Mytilus edulis TaxID=6550 RepID=A0A8S3S2C7_MYTED|nr:unnamed protein product [Mytilus edulis]